MTNIINAIPTYVLTAVVSAFLIMAIRYAHTFVHGKALHAKTAQSRELWSFMDQVASTAVASLVSADKTGDQKFTAATTIVQDALTKQGFTTVDVKAIEAAVQAAYEKSPLTPNSTQHQVPYPYEGKEVVITPAGKAAAIDPKKGDKNA